MKTKQKKVHRRHDYHHFFVFIMMWEDCLCHEELQMTWQVVLLLRLRLPHRHRHYQIRSPTAARFSDRAGRRTNDRYRRACPSTLPLPAVHRHHSYAVVACAVGTNIAF
jgi:hypothetical protein